MSLYFVSVMLPEGVAAKSGEMHGEMYFGAVLNAHCLKALKRSIKSLISGLIRYIYYRKPHFTKNLTNDEVFCRKVKN